MDFEVTIFYFAWDPLTFNWFDCLKTGKSLHFKIKRNPVEDIKTSQRKKG